jgi:hypothetical protein
MAGVGDEPPSTPYPKGRAIYAADWWRALLIFTCINI